MADAEIQRQGGVFSPEGVMMLGIFGILDIIDFLIGSLFIVDILAVLFYSVWVYFRSQAIAASEAQARITETRRAREEKRQQLGEKQTARKQAPMAKKGKWLRRCLFFLEWIPIIGMIPGWTLMVYSELKS